MGSRRRSHDDPSRYMPGRYVPIHREPSPERSPSPDHHNGSGDERPSRPAPRLLASHAHGEPPSRLTPRPPASRYDRDRETPHIAIFDPHGNPEGRARSSAYRSSAQHDAGEHNPYPLPHESSSSSDRRREPSRPRPASRHRDPSAHRESTHGHRESVRGDHESTRGRSSSRPVGSLSHRRRRSSLSSGLAAGWNAFVGNCEPRLSFSTRAGDVEYSPRPRRVEGSRTEGGGGWRMRSSRRSEESSQQPEEHNMSGGRGGPSSTEPASPSSPRAARGGGPSSTEPALPSSHPTARRGEGGWSSSRRPGQGEFPPVSGQGRQERASSPSRPSPRHRSASRTPPRSERRNVSTASLSSRSRRSELSGMTSARDGGHSSSSRWTGRRRRASSAGQKQPTSGMTSSREGGLLSSSRWTGRRRSGPSARDESGEGRSDRR